ncbi:MAG: hypothetical protein HYZ26_05325 [Chloroflexi bacterium]|nr:hypothetical protein [Chloroflexota bacterium]
MSGWDWLHASLELATYSKILQTEAGAKASKEAEATREAFLAALRSFVLDTSSAINLASDQLDEYPQRAYIVAQCLDFQLTSSGISEDTFLALGAPTSDADYLLETRRKIGKVVQGAQAKLTEGELQEAVVAVQYGNEMPLLRRAISAKASLESLMATNGRWRKLANNHFAKKVLFIGSGCLGLLLFAWLGLSLLFRGLSLLTRGDFGGLINGLMMLAACGIVPISSITLIAFSGRSSRERAILETERADWSRQLMSSGDWQEVLDIFGDRSSEEYVKIYEERLAFLAPLLGTDFGKQLMLE